MISASSNSTCVSFPADSGKNQESSDLLLSTNNIVNSDISPSGKLLNDAEKTIRDLECENAKLTERIRQLTAEIEQLTSNNNQLQAKVFSIDRFIKSDKDLSFYTGFPNGDVLESVLRYLEKKVKTLESFRFEFTANL